MVQFESEILRIESIYSLSAALKFQQEAIICHLIDNNNVWNIQIWSGKPHIEKESWQEYHIICHGGHGEVETNPDTGQTILSGMGELHLDIIKNRILKEYRVDAYMGPLQIAYKEALKNTAQYSETLDRTVGDRHNQVSLTISICPSKDNIEFKQVELDAPHDKPLIIKWQHLKAINSGVSSALNNGPVLGFPVINVRVKLHQFQFRMGTSLPMMSACAFQCVTKALQESGCILLEPLMSLEIIAEETHVNAILGDLSRRRGQIEQIGTRHGAKLIQAVAPLAEMMGYSTSLRTISSGTATFTMDLSHYEKVSTEEHNKAVERVTGFSPI